MPRSMLSCLRPELDPELSLFLQPQEMLDRVNNKLFDPFPEDQQGLSLTERSETFRSVLSLSASCSPTARLAPQALALELLEPHGSGSTTSQASAKSPSRRSRSLQSLSTSEPTLSFEQQVRIALMVLCATL